MKPYPAAPDGLVIEPDGPVLRLRLDRPERRNAITDDIVLAMIEAIEAAASDIDIRVIALSATGEHFCSGFDLGLRGQRPERPRTGSTQRQMRWHVNRLIPTLQQTQTPIVCSVTGFAMGLGLNVALASDFTIVADDARLKAPFTGLGFTPDSGSSWLIPRLAGVARAKEMIMLGREITGAEAASWGLVHRAVPAAEVAAASEALIGELATAATVAVGLAKLMIHRGLTADLERHLVDEAFSMELSSRSADFAEASSSQTREARHRLRRTVTMADLAFSHLGLCVADLDRSMRFYCEGLGFEPAERYDLDSREAVGLDRALEVASPAVLTSQMIAKGAMKIELLHYSSPEVSGTPSPSRGLLGFTHVSFYVDDVDAVGARLIELGGTILPDTRVSMGVELLFLADPDGARVELMAMPKT